MSKVTLNTIASRYGSLDALNDNFDQLEAAIDNTLSRDGTGPNAMEAPLDMGGNAVLNVSSLSVTSLSLAGQNVIPASNAFAFAGFNSNPLLTATANQTSFTVATSIAPTSLILVFVNGIKIPSSSVSFSGTTVTLPALQAGDEVEVVELKRL